MKRALLYLAFIVLACVTSCELDFTKGEKNIGRYVYQSLHPVAKGAYPVIHTSKDCPESRSAEYIDTTELYIRDGDRFCTKCVTDKQYNQLSEISKRNFKRADEERNNGSN